MKNIFEKYKTIEVVEMPFNPKCGDDPLFEFELYVKELERHKEKKDNYIIDRLGKDCKFIDYPQRTNFVIDNKRLYYHVAEAYYSNDRTRRVLISASEYSDDVTLIFQQG